MEHEFTEEQAVDICRRCGSQRCYEDDLKDCDTVKKALIPGYKSELDLELEDGKRYLEENPDEALEYMKEFDKLLLEEHTLKNTSYISCYNEENKLKHYRVPKAVADYIKQLEKDKG